MKLRFTITDRNSVDYLIDEPVGANDIATQIKRDSELHGMFFDFQNNDFEYYDKAFRMIKAEYEAHGIRGKMSLTIEEYCGSWEVIYTGRFQFGGYNPNCGDSCSVKIPLETTSDIMQLRNLWDQKVDMFADKAFDQVTPLPAYDKLPFTLDLPSKALLLQNKAESSITLVADELGAPYYHAGAFSYNGQIGQWDLAMDKTVASEIGSFYMNPSPKYTPIKTGIENGTGYNLPPFTPDTVVPGVQEVFALPLPTGSIQPIYIWPRGGDTVVNYASGTPNYRPVSITVDTDIRIKGKFKALNSECSGVAVVIVRMNKTAAPDYLHIHYVHLRYIPGSDIHAGDELSFDTSYTNAALVINPDDEIYALISVTHAKDDTQAQNQMDAFRITFDPECYWRMKHLSLTPRTQTKAFLINEVLSRITESVTNGSMRAYSGYFGRTDSQPYAVADDGCGSLEALTKGLFIRRKDAAIEGQPPAFAISMDDMQKGLDPIHRIGFGIETDTLRPGFNRLRVERWDHFYSDQVILTCNNVDKIERKVIENEHYSQFAFGYEKWEAEQYTGLDEFLTKRMYRTTLTEVKNTLTKLSKFIGSGYAMEITRRLEDTSKDWRYDNEPFIICVKRNGEDIVVELGGIDSPSNIIDPPSIYNFRIRPAANAMRWLSKILAGFRPYSTADKIIFTDGDANYHAAGKQQDPWCRMENTVVAENDDLSPVLFQNPAAAVPKLRPERVVYTYPMSLKDWKRLMANPEGLIAFNNHCESGQGWIDTAVYKHQAGTVQFNLIPKYVQ